MGCETAKEMRHCVVVGQSGQECHGPILQSGSRTGASNNCRNGAGRGRSGIPGEAVVQLSQLEVGGHKHLVMRLRPDDLLLSGLARDVWLRGKRPFHAGHNVIIECCN